MGGASLTHDTTTLVGANALAARPVGEWAGSPRSSRGATRATSRVDLAAVPAGVPARRLAGVAGAEVDLRWRWAALDFIPSARIEVMQDAVSHRDARGVPLPDTPAVFRKSPVLRAALVRPLFDQPALEDRRQGERRALRARAVVRRAVRERHGLRAGQRPDLVPESGTNADVGISVDRMGDWLGLTSRTTLFSARIDDLIQWQYSSWGQARADNIGRARIAGVEQELRLSLGRRVRLVGQGTYLDARDDSDNTATNGKQIPYHPRWRAYLRPELTRIAMPGGLELGAYADADARSAQLHGRREPGRSRAPADHRMRRFAGVAARAHAVTGSAANLTDTRQEDVDAWALPGRAVFVALAYAPVGGDVRRRRHLRSSVRTVNTNQKMERTVNATSCPVSRELSAGGGDGRGCGL